MLRSSTDVGSCRRSTPSTGAKLPARAESHATTRSQGSVSTTQARITVDGPLGAGGYELSGRGGVHDLVAPSGERSYLSGGVGDALAKLEAPLFEGHARALF